jgi:mono/diheme cytochrome c family protein
MKLKFQLLALLLAAAFLLAACASGGASQTPPPTGHEHPAPPADYAGKTNPLAGDAAAAETGKQLYITNCAACHGEGAHGDGPAAAALNPPPRSLADEIGQLSDDYLFWRISTGGAMAPFHSSMPAWKSILPEDQIWQIITFLRTLP